MPDGGETRATLILDASQFVAGSQQAQAALSALDQSGARVTQSTAGVETNLQSVSAALQAAGASGDGFAQRLQAAAAAADSAQARVDALALKAQAAGAALTEAQTAAATSAESLNMLREALNIDSTNLADMRAELAEMEASGTASAASMQELRSSIAELDADSANLSGQIDAATQAETDNAAAVDTAQAKYAQLSAQLNQAQVSASGANDRLSELTMTLNTAGGSAMPLGGMVSTVGAMGSSTMTMAARSLSSMAVSAAGMSTATVQGRLAASALAVTLRTLVRSLSAASIGFVALGAGAAYGMYKLVDSALATQDFGEAFKMAMTDAADEDYTAALKNVDVKLSDEDGIKTKIHDKFQEIMDTLTDGKADTPKIVGELKDGVAEEFSGLSLQIDEYFTSAINNADTSAAKEALQAQWTAIKASLSADEQATQDFVDTYAGQATATCEEAITQLESIQARIDALVASVSTSKQLLDSVYGDSYRKTSGGYYADKLDVEYSLTYIGATKANAEAAAEEARTAALEALNDAFNGKDGSQAQTVTYDLNGVTYQMTGTWDELTQGITDDYQTAMDNADAQLLVMWDKFKSGLIASGTFVEETAVADQLSAAIDAKNIIGRVAEGIDGLDVNPDIFAGLTDNFWQQLGKALGKDPAVLSQQFSDVLASSPLLAADAMAGLESQLNKVMTSGLGDLEGGNFAALMASAIESGIFDGIDGIDLTDSESALSVLMGNLSTETEPAEVTPTVSVKPEYDGMSDAPEVVDVPITAEATVDPSAAAAAAAQAAQSIEDGMSNAPEVVDVPLNIETTVGPPDTSAADAAATAAGTSTAAAYDAALSTGGEQGGTAVGTAAATALTAAVSGFAAIGDNAGRAFTTALSAWASRAAAAATAIGSAAYTALKRSLSINSPSRKMRELGGYSGEGFALGLSDKIKLTEKSARQLAGAGLRAAGSTTNNNTNTTNITFPGAVVRSDDDLRSLSRRFARLAADQQHGRS